jgi:glycosyltransferase involved in cell wall biosynthesis
VIEAQAMRRPVIASDLGGPVETVEHGVTGWRVPPGDAGALATAIEQVLVTVEQLAGYRQQASIAERAIRASVLGGTADCRELYVSTAMARGLEQAAHTLARCGLIVRDYVLNTTSAVTNIP